MSVINSEAHDRTILLEPLLPSGVVLHKYMTGFADFLNLVVVRITPSSEVIDFKYVCFDPDEPAFTCG